MTTASSVVAAPTRVRLRRYARSTQGARRLGATGSLSSGSQGQRYRQAGRMAYANGPLSEGLADVIKKVR